MSTQEIASTIAAFNRIPGTGFMFKAFTKPDAKTKGEQKRLAKGEAVPTVTVLTGHLTFPGKPKRDLEVRARLETKRKLYTVHLHEYPANANEPTEAWKEVAMFTLPTFGPVEKNPDGSAKIASVNSEVTLDGRTYKIRAMRIIKEDSAYIKLRLPQVSVSDPRTAAESFA